MSINQCFNNKSSELNSFWVNGTFAGFESELACFLFRRTAVKKIIKKGHENALRKTTEYHIKIFTLNVLFLYNYNISNEGCSVVALPTSIVEIKRAWLANNLTGRDCYRFLQLFKYSLLHSVLQVYSE